MSTPRKLGPLQVILLAIPCVAVLVVPFFYWWQLLWVPVSGLFIGIVYKMVVPAGSGD